MSDFEPYVVRSGLSAERRNDFLKRNSVEYRKSVIEVFRKMLVEMKGSDLIKPKRIIEEMATFSEHSVAELETRFLTKLDNVKRGKSSGLDDIEFFELIENFIWKHRPENIQALNIAILVRQLGNSLSIFVRPNEYDRNLTIKYDSGIEFHSRINEDSGVEHLKEGVIYKGVYLTTFDNEPTTWSEMAPRSRTKTTDSQRTMDRSFFAIKKIEGRPFDLAISFCESTGNKIHYGVHLPARSLILLKSFKESSPVYIDYSQGTKRRLDNDSFNLPKTHTVFKNYFEPIEDCQVYPFYSRPDVVAFAKLRAKEIFTNFGF